MTKKSHQNFLWVKWKFFCKCRRKFFGEINKKILTENLKMFGGLKFFRSLQL